MLPLIIQKELQAAYRNRSLAVIFLSLLIMLSIAFTGARWQYKKVHRERAVADAQFRQQWNGLKEYNPHSAAHYGTWLFKPLTVLSTFDKGLHNVTGYAMRVEAHHQHNLAAAPVRPADNYMRFGELTMAVVLQLFFPLFIIFFCYNTYTQERESGTLRLLLLQGGQHEMAIRGKAGAGTLMITGVFLLSMLLFGSMLFIQGRQQVQATDVGMFFLLMVCYMLYLCVFVLLAVVVSVAVKYSRQALFVLLGIWLLWNVMAPRLTAAIGETMYPLPSQHAFEERIEQGIRFGINGKTPRQERADAITKELLQKYGVTDEAKLPVNLSGILMQADEDYGQMVYERSLQEVDSIIRLQNNITSYATIADPYLAIRSISMALSGTDYAHQAHFAAAARDYRNMFIRRLNEKMAYGGSRTGDFEWKADDDFYRSMPAFNYQHPAVGAVLYTQLPNFIVLLLWLLAGIYLLNKLAKHEPVI